MFLVRRARAAYHHESERVPQELDIYKRGCGREQDATEYEHVEEVCCAASEGRFLEEFAVPRQEEHVKEEVKTWQCTGSIL